jgi:hypothetical protein
MGRFIDEEELQKYIMHDGCEKGCGYIDERDLKYIQTVEAIPKDQYEARLKADLEAILEEISITIEEEREDCEKLSNSYERFGIRAMAQRSQIVIQDKINALKGNEDE